MEFLEAMKRLIEERLPYLLVDHEVIFGPCLTIYPGMSKDTAIGDFMASNIAFFMYNNRVVYYKDEKDAITWKFDIANPEFNPEDIVKWIDIKCKAAI